MSMIGGQAVDHTLTAARAGTQQVVLEHCETLRLIAAGGRACSAHWFVGSTCGPQRHSREMTSCAELRR